MVSNFAVCVMPFLAGFYSRYFILEMFSMRYVNVFGFFLLFVSSFMSSSLILSLHLRTDSRRALFRSHIS